MRTSILISVIICFSCSPIRYRTAKLQNQVAFEIARNEITKSHNINKMLVDYYFNAKQAQIDGLVTIKSDSILSELYDPIYFRNARNSYEEKQATQKLNELIKNVVADNLTDRNYIKSYLDKTRIKLTQVLNDRYEKSLRNLDKNLDRSIDRNIKYDEFEEYDYLDSKQLDFDRLNKAIDFYLLSYSRNSYLEYEYENEINNILSSY